MSWPQGSKEADSDMVQGNLQSEVSRLRAMLSNARCLLADVRDDSGFRNLYGELQTKIVEVLDKG